MKRSKRGTTWGAAPCAEVTGGALTVCVLAAVAACAGDVELVQAERSLTEGAPRPNVVVVMVDDLDVDTMDDLLRHDLTPNIEHYLVNEGLVFDRSFVATALCCPSRATFLTGQYAHNTGVYTGKVKEENGGVDALDDTSTLATWMQDAGYRTGHIGKYLNGYGLNETSPIPQLHPTYVPPGWDHWQATIGSGTYNTFNYRINNTVDGVTHIARHGEGPEDYQTTVLSRRATRFLRDAEERDDAQPFFLVVAPLAPHSEGRRDKTRRWSHYLNPDPMDLVEKPEQMALIQTLSPRSFDKPSFDYSDPLGPTWVRQEGRDPLSETDKADLIAFYRDRLAAMLAVDDLVGKLISNLKQSGELDNTVIIFTSDNGYLFGEHRLHGKRVAYEESIRVPLFIRIPGTAPAVIDHKVLNADLAPTITALTGVVAGHAMDGRSLLPIIADAGAAWRRRVLIEYLGEQTDIPAYAGLRTDDYLFVRYFDDSGQRELYDLRQDPFQTDNVWDIADHAAAGHELEALLEPMRQCRDGSCQTLEQE